MQKGFGKRLRKLKKQIKGLGNLGLNDACIDRLQNYYSIAVQSNVGDLTNMKKAINAALIHWAYCPGGGNWWCSFRRDKSNNTNVHVHSYGLGKEAIKQVKPIFEDLSKDELLSRCLHGKTQNQNESFNGIMWNRVPKQRFIKLKSFEIGVYDSVAHFNVGNLVTLLIYDADCGRVIMRLE